MWGLLQKSVKGHRLGFLMAFFASMILYTVMGVTLQYDCRMIMEHEDVTRHVYYDVTFSKALSIAQLQAVCQKVQDKMGDTMAAVAYLSDAGNMQKILFVENQDEIAYCGSQLSLKQGALVDQLMEPQFALQFPKVQYETTTQAMVYGSKPDLLAAVVCLDHIRTAQLQDPDVEQVILRMHTALNILERRQIRRLFQQEVGACTMNYASSFRWGLRGLQVYRGYVLLALLMYLYTLLCNCLMLEQLIKQLETEVRVYIQCGISKKSLRKYWLGFFSIFQMAAAFMAILCVCCVIHWIPAMAGGRMYMIPPIMILVNGGICIALAQCMVGHYEKRYA